MPLSIPSLLALVIIRTPDWSGWATIVVGLAVSAFMHFIFDVNWLLPLFGGDAFTHREFVDLTVISALVAQLVITGGFFVASSRFYKEPVGKRKEELDEMVNNLAMPISKGEEATVNRKQGEYLGRMTQVLGALIVLIGVFTNGYADKATFFMIGGLIFFSGCHLYRSRIEPKGEQLIN
jgi:hypothetical protein